MMPGAEEILIGLRSIANEWRWLAVFWHLYFAVFVVAIASGMRPPLRIVGAIPAVPLCSVSVLAWNQANPFNGLVFGVTAILLLLIALRLPLEPVRTAPRWLVVVGALMAGFGWGYPHFLENADIVEYLYAAPVGLLPCPTTSIVIGFSLVFGGLGSRAWSVTVAVVGLFYGAFGAAMIGVWIDWTLFGGALAMLLVGIFERKFVVSGDGCR